MSRPDNESAPAPADSAIGGSFDSPTLGSELVRQLVLLLTNVTVLTALLVYFGWRRSETQNQRLGFDESVLGMSTQDYVLRSVGPVLQLLAIVAGAGIVWWLFDRGIRHSLAQADSDGDKATRASRGWRPAWWPRAINVISIALVVGAATALLAFPESGVAYVAWPLALGAAVLLLLYAVRLRDVMNGRQDVSTPTKGLAFLVAGITLFWAGSNHAEVLGNRFADEFTSNVSSAVRVVVYSKDRMHLDRGRTTETPIGGEESTYKYRYEGLRFLDRTGGRFFLVTENWSADDGVIIVLPDDQGVRLEFARGRP